MNTFNILFFGIVGSGLLIILFLFYVYREKPKEQDSYDIAVEEDTRTLTPIHYDNKSYRSSSRRRKYGGRKKLSDDCLFI